MSYLIPRIRSLHRIIKDCDDFGFWQQSVSSHRCLSGIEVISTLLKQDHVAVATHIRKEIHVPNTKSQDRNRKFSLLKLYNVFNDHF